ncbi:hypothetical protein SAMN05421539_109142 [Jannaschia seohaensis]|uniref:Hpt domain-containing protein n=2 Tax=Jannaschia seohaensis TaxID=475081 RepID=A0A2Y9AYX4_9RHOB|nr:hypothetical protein BCF38_109142 [Jannaschia seohaensis]SSA49336.1 hypothetical protein SAMN05421539_109142 [Jannaschia seohaensis]
MRAVLEIFRIEADQVIRAIETPLDDEGHAKAIHFLRSGALNLGLTSFAGQTEDLANIPREGRAKCGKILRQALDLSLSKIDLLNATA